MTVDVPETDPAIGLRRLFAVGFVLALAGAAAALGIFLSRGSSGSKPSIFPVRFSENGFVSAPVRLDRSYDAAAGASGVTGQLSAGRTAYVIARCDHGGVVVKAGSLTTSAPCTGQAQGVITLSVPRSTTITATVSEAQARRWGIAIYR